MLISCVGSNEKRDSYLCESHLGFCETIQWERKHTEWGYLSVCERVGVISTDGVRESVNIALVGVCD